MKKIIEKMRTKRLYRLLSKTFKRKNVYGIEYMDSDKNYVIKEFNDLDKAFEFAKMNNGILIGGYKCAKK